MATTTAPKPAVVLIGITDSHPAIPNDLRDKLRSAIAESRTQMHDAGYHDFVSLPIDPDNDEQALKALTDVLVEKHRAAVIIGGGLRKMPQMIPILEEIINTTKDVSPKTQILFTEWPTGIFDSLTRLK